MPRKSRDNFKPGDLVFAKMKGFPHWPARICKSEDGYKKRVPVYFYGTHQIGLIPPKNVVPYAGNKNKYGSGVRIKGFTEGMWEIQNTPGVGSKLKVPAKTSVKSASNKTINDKPKRIPSKLNSSQSAPATADSKPGSGRSTPSKVTAETEAAAKTPSTSERESKQTPDDATATDDSEPAVTTRRGTASSNQSTPAGRRTRQATSSTASAKSEEAADAEQHKKAPAGPAAATPASKKQKVTETRSASRQMTQNDREETEERTEDRRRKKAKKDIDVGKKQEQTKEKTEEKSAESHVMKTRGAEKEEQKLEVKEGKKEERTGSEENRGTKRKRQDKEAQKTKPGSEAKKEEKPGEKPVKEERKTRRAEKEKRTKETAKKKTVEDERDGETGGGSVDQQRQRHLASQRESVLTSLRGLLKDGRRGRRAMKSSLKVSDRAKRSMEARKTSAKISVKELTVAEVTPGVKTKLYGKSTAAKEEQRPRGEEKGSTRKDGGNVSTAEKTKDEQKTTRKNTEDKDHRQQNEDETKGEEAHQHRDEEKKQERKIIGKIVKATAKQGTKVKTMMGGLMVAAAEEEKKNKDHREARTRAATEDNRDTTATSKSEDKSGGKSQEKKKDEKAAQKSDRAAAEAESHAPHEDKLEQLQPEAKKCPTMTLTDSTLHRIHGDIRISLKSDNPDIGKCLKALDQLSMVYVTSQHVQRHSELVATLRKMRFYRANQAVMDKASMLYNRFKNAFLAGQGEEVVSAAFLRSLLEEKEREEGLQGVAAGSDGGGEEGRQEGPVDSS